MKLEQYRTIYFLGIGGIGMSALARWFIKAGRQVSGYDRTSTPLTDALQAEGMKIHFDDAMESTPQEVRSGKDNTLVIFTPAIPKDHKEYNYLKDNNYTILKRSEVLGLISKDYKTIAVAGTHGKTTTSSMVAHILKTARKSMVAFLGGIATNYESNLVMEGEVGYGWIATFIWPAVTEPDSRMVFDGMLEMVATTIWAIASFSCKTKSNGPRLAISRVTGQAPHAA